MYIFVPFNISVIILKERSWLLNMSGNYSYQYDMKYTDNPYIDLIVRDVKNMAINSVVKNERDALKYETLESRKASDELIHYMNGLPVSDSFIYENYNELNNYYRQLYGLQPYPTNDEIRRQMQAGSFLTQEDAERLINAVYASKYVPIEPYIQRGLDEHWIKYDAYVSIIDLIYGPNKIYNYIHEVQTVYNNKSEYNKDSREMARKILEFLDPDLDPQDTQTWNIYKEIEGKSDSTRAMVNILDLMKEDYTGPDFKYLYHLCEKAIEPYIARTAPDFSLLYCPKPVVKFGQTNTEFPIYYKFLRCFDRNRQYVTSCIYSDAYAFGSEHYEDVLIILLLIQTMIDLITEVQEYIINKDIFDSRTIRYLFESYGVDYYKEIPMKYQVRLIKNINEIIKYKSTNKNILDIKNLFGREDIDIFTYWLLKIKKKPRSEFSFYTEDDVGEPVSDTSPHYVTPDMVGMEKYAENYDLAFLKVPITDQTCEKYIEDPSFRVSYDDITLADPFWDGLSKDDILSDIERENYHKRKKQEILEKDFSYERTKYIAVDAAIDVTEYSYEATYFMNILFSELKMDDPDNPGQKKNVTDLLELDIDTSICPSGRVKMTDLMTLMIALGYVYNGIEPDVIASDMEINMTINGFNFQSDWSQVYDSLKKLTKTYQEAGPEYKRYLDNIVPDALKYLPKDEETDTYDDSYVCGRYDESDVWNGMKNFSVVDFFEGYYEATYHVDGQVLKKAYFKVGEDTVSSDTDHPAYLHDPIEAGLYDASERIRQLDSGLWSHLIDITWVPYTDNTHASFISLNEIKNFAEDDDLGRFDKIKEIYYTNSKLRDHLNYMMKHADTKREYDVYKVIYESFMETVFTKKYYTYYRNGEAVIADTFEEWLENRDADLFTILRTAQSYSTIEDRREYINQVCEYAVYALEKYFDTSEWNYLYNLIPAYNQQFVRDWITKIIMFFKSWKTQLIQTTAVMNINDNSEDGRSSSADNCVYVMDNISFNSFYQPLDRLRPVDMNFITTTFSPREKVTITDKVNIVTYNSYYQTTYLDFMYSNCGDHIKLNRYLSPYTAIRLPEVIEDLPCTEIDNTCFMGTTVNCIIPDCYTTIS